MTSDAQGAAHAGHGEAFPFVRMLGPVALIGVNSAVPTPPLVASGRLGAEQLARLAAVLERLGGAGVFRLVLIHHPPLPGQAKRYRDLEDAADLEAVLARHGAELVIHGHNHHNMLAWCATSAGGKVPVVGAPSASLGRPHKARAARPLQPLPHRRAALDHRADRPRPASGGRPDRRARAAQHCGRRLLA